MDDFDFDLDVDFDVTPGLQRGFYDTALKMAPKRIVVCCDGTWQSSVTNETNIPSNVTRLARYLLKAGRDQNNQVWQQLVYYDAGIGTGVVSTWETDLQGGTGSGFVVNVIKAYNFIVLNYNPGDQVFCLGFSRGAYTARAVAGLVTDIGIVQPRDMQDFPELYRLYQTGTDSHTFRKTDTWRKWVEGDPLPDPVTGELPQNWRQNRQFCKTVPHGAAPESTRWVEAVGVFDTVGSLGIPHVQGWAGKAVDILGKAVHMEHVGFHNVALSPYIKHAYHAMALDEHRGPFDTTLWHFPADGVAATPAPKAPATQLKAEYEMLQDSRTATEAELSKAWEDLVDAEMYEELKGSDSKLLQVWFPGVHINVGGGSNDLLKDREGDFEQIATVTLFWMAEQLTQHLEFEINFTTLASQDRFMMMKPAVEELLRTNPTNNWLIKDVNDALAKGPPKDPWNDNNRTRRLKLAAKALKGWATGPIIDSYVGGMKLAGSTIRTPGGYKETKDKDGNILKLGKTNEMIHPTVMYRRTRNGYDPNSLKDFKRVQVKTDDQKIRYEWVKGDIRLPEWVLGKNYERNYLKDRESINYVAALDKEYGSNPVQTMEVEQSASQKKGPYANVGFQG